MFKNFWYVAGVSSEFSNKPKRVRMLGQNLVVFRDEEGTLRALSDICIHRGGSLSGGTVEGGCVRCPYHGWKFDGAGKCVDIPATRALKKALPKRARVDAYPTAERYGFGWVFMGDLPEEERPPVPEFPGFTTEGFRAVYGQFEWQGNVRRVVENSLDPAHAAWVHRNSFGSNSSPEVPRLTVETFDWGAQAPMVLESPKLSGIWGKLRKQRNDVHVTNGFTMPSVTFVHMKFGKFQTRLFNAAVPVDRFKTVTHWVIIRDFFQSKLFDGDTHRRTMKIFLEDAPIVANQLPELVPEHNHEEVHVHADALTIAYRNMCADAEAKGWVVRGEEVETGQGKRVALIPSPARREPESRGQWVMKEAGEQVESAPVAPPA